MNYDNPLLVRWEYASEERLEKRNAILRGLSVGTNPEQVALEAVAELKPKRILDVGCGLGELGERFAQEFGAEVHAIDTSPRMVELARARGVDAQIGDAERLPFPDNSFDCVFAGWVLYHVPNVTQAITECARVLEAKGTLVAASVCNDNVDEVWGLLGGRSRQPLSFTRENGEALLQPYFTRVERRDIDGSLVFPDTQALRTFVASTIDSAHLAPNVPELAGPFTATTRHVVFMASAPLH
jgi:ubiquinone/menaquinone biosynthesis C-methylase UbiE